MKRKIVHIILLVSAVLLSTCKKLPLPTEEETEVPVFYVKCEINGAPVSIEAGKNDYYMYSSHFQNNDKVYVYKGELKQKSCSSGCGYNLAILINDFKISALNEIMNPDSGLYLGRYGFNDGSPDPVNYSGSFTPLYPGVNSYTWTYSDGYPSQGGQGTRLFAANRTYSVGLKINSQVCVSEHVNEFRPGSPLTCNFAVTPDITASPTSFTFASTAPQGAAHFWDFGDGTTSSNAVAIHTYTAEGIYTVKLKLSQNGETINMYYQAAAMSGACDANYNCVFYPMPNPLALSNIAFQVTDAAGNIYTTETLNQASSSKVEIVSVEEYEKNSQGHSTRKVKLKFSCDVKNGNSILQIRNGEAVIAVSYN